MIRNGRGAVVVAFSALLSLGSVRAEAQTAVEILSGAFLFGESAQLRIRATMTIHERDTDRDRDLDIAYSRADEAHRTLIQIVSPAFLRNLKFLQISGANAESQQWLRTSQGVRRLSSTQQNERLFDSDFTAEDLAPIAVDDYALTLRAQDVEGCRVIRAVPENSGRDYAFKDIYVDRATQLVRRVDFFAAGERLVRQYRVLEQRTVDGSLFPSLLRMETFADGTWSLLRLDSIDPSSTIPDSLFNRGNL